MATGLAIDSSDMDVLVSGAFSTEGPVDRALLIDQMKKLHKQLNSLVCLESNSLIETASVPVIKIVNFFNTYYLTLLYRFLIYRS
jgi:DNA polymerase sigma